jgi:beta-glucosidase
MTGYNKVNGTYAGGNEHLLQEVLKGDWGYPGWVMSDWGATPEWEFALAGLDQESGLQIDVMFWDATPFVEPLRAAYDDGRLPKERLSEMVRRILRSIYAAGADAWDDAPGVDLAAHREIALEAARQGIVVLENDGVLPLSEASVAVIGGHAQLGVPAGTGSSAVTPEGGYAAVIPIGGPGIMGGMRNLYLHPSSPLAELESRLPRVEFDPGMLPAEAALLARRCDIAVVFGVRVEGEGYDQPDLALPWGQDAVIEAVADANPNTVVVLETGNPVAMPWRDKVRAIVQAWYPGQAGGQAIAEVLTGEVNPSGRLPVTFPASMDQHPRPELPGLGTEWGTATTIEYQEGAEVGYRWFAQTGDTPLYAFGHGLSYTTFEYADLELEGATATFTVTNTGERAGADVAQLYLTEPRMRLLGFERVELAAGESRRVTIAAEPKVLAFFDAGPHRVAVARAADAPVLTGALQP